MAPNRFEASAISTAGVFLNKTEKTTLANRIGIAKNSTAEMPPRS